jgi:hypothetical protein
MALKKFVLLVPAIDFQDAYRKHKVLPFFHVGNFSKLLPGITSNYPS